MTQIAWLEPSDLELTIVLDMHWNKSGTETATLRFVEVKNRPEVEAALKGIADNRGHEQWVAEIVSFRRHDTARYLLDTTPQPPLIIECAALIEI